MLQVSTHQVRFNSSERIQYLSLKNMSLHNPLIYKIKTNNFEAVDAKPNIQCLGPSQIVKVAVRSLKPYKFQAKLQILSAELQGVTDPYSIVPEEEFRKLTKAQTESNLINIRQDGIDFEKEGRQYMQYLNNPIREEDQFMVSIRQSSEIHDSPHGSANREKSQRKGSDLYLSETKTDSTHPEYAHVQRKVVRGAQKPEEIKIQEAKILRTVENINTKAKECKDNAKAVINQTYYQLGLNALASLNAPIKISIMTMLIIVVTVYLIGFLFGRYGGAPYEQVQIKPKTDDVMLQVLQPQRESKPKTAKQLEAALIDYAIQDIKEKINQTTNNYGATQQKQIVYQETVRTQRVDLQNKENANGEVVVQQQKY